LPHDVRDPDEDNQAEHQLEFVHGLRLIADGQLDGAEACRSYHAEHDLTRLVLICGVTPGPSTAAT
jgi:hypothetical protein